MRSLIVLEVEHGEDTDVLQTAIHHFQRCRLMFDDMVNFRVTDYTVKVDIPACFVLDSGSTDEQEENHA